MALVYLGAGINHFRIPEMYERIVPYYFNNKKFINQASGVAEIILGIGLLVPATTTIAAWGVIALLIAVFPAHIYQIQENGAGMKVPLWALWLRLPFQLVLIVWAYRHTF